jgi:hypothetical protein
MDPLTVSAVAGVLRQVLGGATAEAGKNAWAGLVKLVRSAFPERAAVAEAAEQLTPGVAPDQNAVIDLSAELVGLARTDAGFEGALREWLGRAGSLSVDGGATTNVIRDGATVHGNVVQARDTGSISFGG